MLDDPLKLAVDLGHECAAGYPAQAWEASRDYLAHIVAEAQGGSSTKGSAFAAGELAE